MLPNEPEVLDARMAYSDAQVALSGISEERRQSLYACGWYGTDLHEERGSFAIVNETGPLADLLGDRLLIRHETRSASVYCFGSTDLPYDIVVTRRVFATLALLAIEEIPVVVEVLAG